MTYSPKKFLFSMAILLIFGSALAAWQFQTINAQTKSLTYSEIGTALNTKLPNAVFKNKTQLINYLITQIEKRGVDKPLTKDREDDLRQAGATNELIEIIRRHSPSLTQTPTPVPTSTATSKVADPSNSNTNTRAGIGDGLGKIISTIANPENSGATVNTGNLRNSFGMEFVLIPNGSFLMGSDDGEPSEKPVHRVTISKPFYLGKTEVTQEQWEKVMASNPSLFKNCPKCPVERVAWNDVQDFIKKLNAKGEGRYRLPTEAEWEYAARAGSTTKYSYGDSAGSLADYAWYSANAGEKTHEVGTKQPNNWGLHDMHGNVQEWCLDWYGSYSKTSQTDPHGPLKGEYRVTRGGSWGYPSADARSSSNNGMPPTDSSLTIGFRIVREK